MLQHKGMGGKAERLVEKLASKMEYLTGQRYSDAVGYIRKRLCIETLRTTVFLSVETEKTLLI